MIKFYLLIVLLSLFSCEQEHSSNHVILKSINSYPGVCPCPYSIKKNGDSCGENSAYSKQKTMKVLCYEEDLKELDNKLMRISSDLFRPVIVTDGDSIKIGKDRIRLQGIDAPEYRQRCKKENVVYKCGEKSRDYLISLINNKKVECTYNDVDRYNRVLGMCFVNGISLNEEMVNSGWALAYRKYNKIFIENELIAKQKKVGIWVGEFEKPWEWRKNN